jgi:hypothetical protein
MSDDQEFTPRDFVYAGRRMLRGDVIGYAIHPINDDGTLAGERLYKLKRYGGIVGCRYTGATFAETSSKGIETAKWVDQWPNEGDRMEWQALDRSAEVDRKTASLKADAKATNEIDRIMLPIRKRIHSANARGDYAGAMALKLAVQISVNKPLRSDQE